MANETVTKSSRFYCVSLLPDICKTPIGPSTPPIPYSIIGEFSQAVNESPNVKAHSAPVILHNRSVIPTVKGDEPGTAGGIKSGTYAKKVETKTASKTYFANGTATVQEGCEVWMNNRNTVGKIYERGGIAPRTRLEQIAAMAREALSEAADETKAALKPAAKYYKENVSEALHDAAGAAMDKGGKVAAGGLALTGTGVVASATGVGAPVGVPLAAAGSIGTAAGGAVTVVGATADTGVTLLDYAADYILSGKSPDLKTVAAEIGQRVVTGVVGSKLAVLKPFLRKEKLGKKSSLPPTPAPRPPDKAKGGKTKKNKEKKSDKPSACCPKNQAPGGKPVASRHPVHFGTGEEVLYQTDFVIDGPVPLEWIRCYRSGSELEDWSMCGARWSTPFTASIAATAKGLVYVDDSGRPMLLPSLPTGATFDNRKEGFTLTRSAEDEFLLQWRDGSTDKFTRTPSADSWLPHGYDGVNVMRQSGDPVFAERYVLCRAQGRDGRGITIERLSEAKPGHAVLRVRSDDGVLIEAMRDEHPSRLPQGQREPVRIDRVEEVRSDGKRVCHVRYEYEAEDAVAIAYGNATTALPTRYNLVRQTNLARNARSYSYRHYLLASYTTYTGFEHTLEWISLAALRERWGGNNALTDNELVEHFPITPETSYQARAIATNTADGLDGVRIAYLDEDTTRVTDANGGVLEYVFDANWLAVEVRRIEASGNARSLGRRVWDNDGNLRAEIDALGRTTRYTYDAAGNLVTTTDALERTSRIEYDRHNQPVKIADPLGNVTGFEYDNKGNISTQVNALGQTTSYRYDEQARLVCLTDANGAAKKIHYDSAGRLSVYTDCSNYRTTYEYDDNGRVIAVIDALNRITRYTYDLAGNIISVCRADGATEQFNYDADGRITAHMDAAGNETRYRYNGHGLPLERTDALGHKVECRYNALLQLCELINAKGESYYFKYDTDGLITSEIGFDGKQTKYGYDVGGNLIKRECGDNSIQLLRDLMGRLVAKQTASYVHRFAYDDLDRLTLAITPHTENYFRYDALGNLVEERSICFLTLPQIDLIGPKCPDAWFSISHLYDALGNRIQTTLPNGRRIDILRYGSGHWHGTLWQSNNLVDIERDSLHREVTRHFGRGHDAITTLRGYDNAARLLKVNIQKGTRRLSERSYLYDLVNNLTDILDQQRGDSHFAYDPLGQLLGSVQPNLRETFDFDLAGTLIDRTVPQVSNYVYEFNNQGNAIAAFRASSNVENESKLKLVYDMENRLLCGTRLEDGSAECFKYIYDALGRRVAKQRWKEQTGTPHTGQMSTTLFVWDGDSLAQEITSSETITFLYEPNSFLPLARIESPGGICTYQPTFKISPISMKTAVAHARGRHPLHPSSQNISSHGEDKLPNQQQCEQFQLQLDTACEDVIHYYECDHLGTPLALLDENGNTVWAVHYRAWGQVLHVGAARAHQPLRFQGQYQDDETGLYYNRNRYYDPRTARYLTQDPIGLLGGVNPYQYAPNPTSWVDPLGLARSKGGCDPCCGKNPAAEASATQGISAANPHNPYTGKDTYSNIVIKKGTILYSLTPGAPPGFAVTNHTLIKAGGNLAKYYDLVQVTTNPGKDAAGVPRKLRDQVRAFRVTEDICVARGKALANTQFGGGGGTQYYVSPSDVGKLSPGKIRFI